jgi:hypothetical protein
MQGLIACIQSRCEHDWGTPVLPITSREGVDLYELSEHYCRRGLVAPCSKCYIDWLAAHKNRCFRCKSQNLLPQHQLDIELYTQAEIDRHDYYDSPFGIECGDCGLIKVWWVYDR